MPCILYLSKKSEFAKNSFLVLCYLKNGNSYDFFLNDIAISIRLKEPLLASHYTKIVKSPLEYLNRLNKAENDLINSNPGAKNITLYFIQIEGKFDNESITCETDLSQFIPKNFNKNNCPYNEIYCPTRNDLEEYWCHSRPLQVPNSGLVIKNV